MKKFKEKYPRLFDELLKRHLLVYYDIPTKQGLIKGYAINGFQLSDKTGVSQSKFGKSNRTIKVTTCEQIFDELKNNVSNTSVLVKLTNTEKYFEYICLKQLFTAF
ncbi:MAG: hypothetical protein EOO46_25680 [Flavobacterium sp.]|nr:MAG: hypothetical protein EOO46_25680 [Flavobacterium sp.]